MASNVQRYAYWRANALWRLEENSVVEYMDVRERSRPLPLGGM